MLTLSGYFVLDNKYDICLVCSLCYLDITQQDRIWLFGLPHSLWAVTHHFIHTCIHQACINLYHNQWSFLHTYTHLSLR